MTCFLYNWGDNGTFLSAVRWLENQQAPILGVKFGAVGFLAETTEDRLCEAAEAIFEHRFSIRLTEDASDIMLTCDGQVGMKVDEHDTLVIRKSPNPVQMITLPDQNYFDVLKTKLKWG